MKITKKQISDIKLAPYNPRRIDDATFEKLKQSIREFGFVEPLVVNIRTGHVVGGNQRLKALEELGIKEAEVVEVDLDEEKEKVLNLALNKIIGDWDYPKLVDVLKELKDVPEIEFSGFTLDEINHLLADLDIVEPIFDKEEKENLDLIVECESREQRSTVEEFLEQRKIKYREK
jgi:ParB-like chromosome segregation protein Spo0J